jgi:hypothetical protein
MYRTPKPSYCVKYAEKHLAEVVPKSEGFRHFSTTMRRLFFLHARQKQGHADGVRP